MIQINKTVLADLARGFQIPSPPDILTQIQGECATDDADINQIAQLIASDIGLSSGILKTINSPLYGMNRVVSDIQQAVMMLGINAVSTLISGLLIRQSFKGEAVISFERLWDNARLVAETMVYIGQNIEFKIPPENLYSTGLFHDCGIAAMSMRYPDYREILMDANCNYEQTQVEIEDARYNTNHAVVGYFIASSWALPKDICQVILNHHELDYLDHHHQNGTDLVYAALKAAENMVNEIKRRTPAPDWPRISDACHMTLGISENDYRDLLEDLDEQWNAAF